MFSVELLDDTRIQLNVAILVLGLLILVVGVLRDFLNAKVPASAITVAMLTGIILGPHVTNVLNVHEWSNAEIIAQEICRIVIAIQLMAIALNIPFHYLTKAWRTQLVLLTLVVALMWVTSGFIIYGFFQTTSGDMYKFSMWESLLMGAAVAPTDPVLASAVSTSALAISQVPARLRHTITAESGLNDGTGFPFVMLTLRFLTRGNRTVGEVFGEWIVKDILWEIILAIIIAVVLGYVIGRMLVFAEPKKLHDQQLLVALTIALAFGFVGGAQLLGINGLIAVVIGGVIYARVVEGDKRGAESQLQETVDLIFSTLVFAVFGLIIPFDRWHLVGWWRGILMCLSIAIFRRVPWIIALRRLFFKDQIHSLPDSLFVGWFGPIGVGAIFYALFAAEELGNDSYWVVISIIVFSQVIIFGVTDTFFTRWYATTNPNYVRRRRRKQREIARAESQIQSIEDNLQYNLQSIPVSPELGANSAEMYGRDGAGDIPPFDLGSDAEFGEEIIMRSDASSEQIGGGSEVGDRPDVEAAPNTILGMSASILRRRAARGGSENGEVELENFENPNPSSNFENNFEEENSFEPTNSLSSLAQFQRFDEPTDASNASPMMPSSSQLLIPIDEDSTLDLGMGNEEILPDRDHSILSMGSRLWNNIIRNMSHDNIAGLSNGSEDRREEMRSSDPSTPKRRSSLSLSATHSRENLHHQRGEPHRGEHHRTGEHHRSGEEKRVTFSPNTPTTTPTPTRANSKRRLSMSSYL